jgi:hypothetical protein
MVRGVDPMILVADPGRPSAGLEGPREGPSRLEQLLRHFEDHEQQERRALHEHRDTIENVEDPMVKFVLNLIQLDEARHYEVVNAMLAAPVRTLFCRQPPAVPGVFRSVRAKKEELLALVKRFIQLERDAIREYESLRSGANGYYEGLFSVLLRALSKDSKKHLMLLEFLQKYLRAAPC